jgi:FkbM family methyltransferase
MAAKLINTDITPVLGSNDISIGGQETMTFISYAQNFEDVMLWRALKHIEGGFYIDIGAWSEDIDSVTRAFYSRGWRGINVEPNSDYYAQLQMIRTRDINLRIAVSDKAGTLIMNFFSNTGLSTLDEALSKKYSHSGLRINKQEVEVTTLTDLWRQYVPKFQAVHFLKIDVEGFELAVLKGNDWSKHRPWIVVVEATQPLTQVESHDSWEPILINANYLFAYADGLNRFYVANEHAEILNAFKYPPNFFDNFKTSALQKTEDKAQQLVASLIAERERSDNLNRELQALKASYCWRITGPLRYLFDLLLRIRIMFTSLPQNILGNIRDMLRLILIHLIRFARAHPLLKAWAQALLRRCPRIEAQLCRFAGKKGIIGGGTLMQTYSTNLSWKSTELSELTVSARRVHADLKAAIERQNRGH